VFIRPVYPIRRSLNVLYCERVFRGLSGAGGALGSKAPKLAASGFLHYIAPWVQGGFAALVVDPASKNTISK
jgi:hypothetical protein